MRLIKRRDYTALGEKMGYYVATAYILAVLKLNGARRYTN
jgi:hypothetical protein